jgi:hypothetical protein
MNSKAAVAALAFLALPGAERKSCLPKNPYVVCADYSEAAVATKRVLSPDCAL